MLGGQRICQKKQSESSESHGFFLKLNKVVTFFLRWPSSPCVEDSVLWNSLNKTSNLYRKSYMEPYINQVPFVLYGTIYLTKMNLIQDMEPYLSHIIGSDHFSRKREMDGKSWVTMLVRQLNLKATFEQDIKRWFWSLPVKLWEWTGFYRSWCSWSSQSQIIFFSAFFIRQGVRNAEKRPDIEWVWAAQLASSRVNMGELSYFSVLHYYGRNSLNHFETIPSFVIVFCFFR